MKKNIERIKQNKEWELFYLPKIEAKYLQVYLIEEIP